MRRNYNKDIENLLGESAYCSGVYKIICEGNGKFYIGSTCNSFTKRLAHHISMLRSGKHKNTPLQRTWNKYGESSFTYVILEITDKSDTLKREQVYLDLSISDPKCLNINPMASGTPNMSEETIKKRADTMKRRYANGEITSNFRKGHEPWNRGMSGTYDTTYLRKPKTLTKKSINRVKELSERFRNNSPTIFAYTKYGDYLGSWRSSKDLEEWSETEDNLLPIMSRFKAEVRMGKKFNYLSSGNINRSAKTGKPYKGIYFTFSCHIEGNNI